MERGQTGRLWQMARGQNRGTRGLWQMARRQIRTSVNQLLCTSKEFSWIRHTIITVALLASTNSLVIFVPSIRDIFAVISASAALLIFILPSAFYIKPVKESMMSVLKIGAVWSR
ncbi:sodium-coupled neutral amino acid transporter 2-like [Micropterus salmoides]|uniref:sodium-coupled neutral amino acid transporter 2-like n=1 Tax=Micropterus salmoides TaxID=27706 RepID=UPI0018EB57CA|nr:sodium-coupled neutral amino acid transporter 2-like [Micropterus salmoides]XP_038595230.1 sodium-coupled neutral amino acid transporter 2-like [Micropterus salmoides]